MHDCPEHMMEGCVGVQGEVSDYYGNGEIKGNRINLHFRWNAKQTVGSAWNSRHLNGGSRKWINQCRQIKSQSIQLFIEDFWEESFRNTKPVWNDYRKKTFVDSGTESGKAA